MSEDKVRKVAVEPLMEKEAQLLVVLGSRLIKA